MTIDTPTPKNPAGTPANDTGGGPATPASGEPAPAEPAAAPEASADATGAPPDPAPEPEQDEDYQVGYCRPPKKNQFKPGQPSPRKGKKKKSELQSLADLQYEIAIAKIPVRHQGKTVMMSRYKTALLKKYELGMAGNLSALNQFIEHTAGRAAWERGFEYRAEMKAAREKVVKMVRDNDPEAFEQAQKIIMDKLDDIERKRTEAAKTQNPPEDAPRVWRLDE